MSFATLVRNRNSERVIALVSALAVMLSMMVMFADRAQAHHPELTASQSCVDGDVIVSWTSESWLTTGDSGSGHSDIRIQMSVGGGGWSEIANGAYTAGNNYRFSGSFDASGYWLQTISLRAYAEGDWDNGSAGGQYSTVTELTINQDCFNPSCPDGYEEYKIDQKPSNGTYGNFTILNFVNGASGETFDWSSTVPVFQVIVKGGPTANVYNYDGATSGTGLHSPTNPNNGKYYGVSHVTFCWDDTPPPPPSGWVCENNAPLFVEDVTGYETWYETEEAALEDPACNPPPPPSGWVCVDGSVLPESEAPPGFEGTVYETEDEAWLDDDCVEVEAATTFTISGSCLLIDGVASFTISGNLGEGVTLNVAGETLLASGAYSIDVGAPGSYAYGVTLDDGFVLAEGSPPVEGVIQIVDCGTAPESGWACIGGETVFIPDASDFDGTLYPSEEAAGQDVGCLEEVAASIVVTVAGACASSGGGGVINVTVSVADGAVVTIENSSGATLATLTDDGSVGVPDNATYSWSATPNEGFEFPVGSATSGTVTIETCVETLPFTGFDLGYLAIVAMTLLAAGAALLYVLGDSKKKII
ncbi:MAG TPA: hypothetical protein VFS66_03925 [Acidimicrobiia bacterium]|nr:hypothetical protein [Acidimicrobiia bacterium]